MTGIIFIMTCVGMAGVDTDRGADVAWSMVEYKSNSDAGCSKIHYYYGLRGFRTAYSGNGCTMSDKSTKYTDDACKTAEGDHKFCDSCASAGDAALGLVSFTFLLTLGGSAIFFMRGRSFDEEEEGWSKMKIAAVALTSAMTIMLIAAFSVWSDQCQAKINKYWDGLSLNDATVVISVYAGWVVTFIASVLSVPVLILQKRMPFVDNNDGHEYLADPTSGEAAA